MTLFGIHCGSMVMAVNRTGSSRARQKIVWVHEQLRGLAASVAKGYVVSRRIWEKDSDATVDSLIDEE
ncbi:unnamed protein product [Calypogeia fissa]